MHIPRDIESVHTWDIESVHPRDIENVHSRDIESVHSRDIESVPPQVIDSVHTLNIESAHTLGYTFKCSTFDKLFIKILSSFRLFSHNENIIKGKSDIRRFQNTKSRVLKIYPYISE